MRDSRRIAKRTADDERHVAPVTIFDAEGRVVRVVPAEEFQRAAAAANAAPRPARSGDQSQLQPSSAATS